MHTSLALRQRLEAGLHLIARDNMALARLPPSCSALAAAAHFDVAEADGGLQQRRLAALADVLHDLLGDVSRGAVH